MTANGGASNMSAANDILDQLSALVERAKFIRKDQQVGAVIQQYNDLFERYQLRLRPSVGSFSLVSCAWESPQLGRSGLASANDLARELKSLQTGEWAIKKPGRSTPEKTLQSWLISTARASGEILPISAAAQDGARYWFVTDEIALHGSDKFVADMLLVKEAENGHAEFVNTELKYTRSMSTFIQVETFRAVLTRGDLTVLWRELAETMTGRQFNWDDSSQSSGLVIWPSLPGDKITPRVTIEKLRTQDRINTLAYSGPQFSLALESNGSTTEATS
jgi:hypothetical protein